MAVNAINQQDEHVGLSGLARDAVGLTGRGQLGWMQWQLFHMPSTWRQKAAGGVRNYGFRWRGPILGKWAASPLEGAYARFTGNSRIPFISPFLRGTSAFENTVAPLNLEAARRAFGADKIPGAQLDLFETRATEGFGTFQRNAALQGERLFNQGRGVSRYGTAFNEMLSGAHGEQYVRASMGESATAEALAAGRGLYRGAARRTLLGGIGRLMYPVTIAMNFALVAELGIGLGTFAGRTATGIVNRLSQYNHLDFGTGIYAASAFRASTTERQRALQAIQRNNLNARRAIGNGGSAASFIEGRDLHMAKKSESHEARFKRCKQHLATQGKSTSSQWAICTASVGRPKKEGKKKK